MTTDLRLPATHRLEVHESLGSTNDEALARARAGEPGPLWIVAREQTAGRGRMGREWRSPRGNLFASLVLRDPSPPALAPQLGFVAAVSLAAAVSDVLRGDRRLGLKWPNDLLFGRAKLAGILLEGAQCADGAFACVFGFGVNCASHPTGMLYPATDLSVVMGRADPMDVLQRLARALADRLEIWDRGRGFARIREEWLSYAEGIGEHVTIRSGSQSAEGVFDGLDEDGRLLLRTHSGVQTIDAGDVFLAATSPSMGFV